MIQKATFAFLFLVLLDLLAMSQVKDIHNKKSLTAIGQNLSGSADKNFEMFLKDAHRINKIAGKNFAENIVTTIIAREEIVPFEKEVSPDWEKIESRVKEKYGALGEERVWGHRAVYYSTKRDWKNYGKYYQKYFERALGYGRSFLHINNLSWRVFEHVEDRKVLASAIKAMKYDLEKFDGNDPYAIDTYANLLYKFGKKNKAIKWEEKAVKLSGNESERLKVLDKMKRGEKTWLVPVSDDTKK